MWSDRREGAAASTQLSRSFGKSYSHGRDGQAKLQRSMARTFKVRPRVPPRSPNLFWLSSVTASTRPVFCSLLFQALRRSTCGGRMLIGCGARGGRVLGVCALVVLINFLHIDKSSAQSLPSPWSAQDIGSPSVPGSSSFDGTRFTVTAAGKDIWGQSDQFRFVYQQVTGDVEIIARVDSVTMANSWSKSGVMIRSSLAANAAHGFALVSAGKGVALQYRAQAAGASSNRAGPSMAPPRWVRLVRSGTNITASSSADGRSWSTIGSASIALGAVAYVGIATTSHNASAATTAVLSQVGVTPLTLPSPQKSMDIGAPGDHGGGGLSPGCLQRPGGGC